MRRAHPLATVPPISSLVCLLVMSMLCRAGSPWSEPVGRATGDRNADLIDALILTGRFSDAERPAAEPAQTAHPGGRADVGAPGAKRAV